MDSPTLIARRWCEQLSNEQNTESFSALERYFDGGGSVCALARKGAAGLVSEYGLQNEDAQALALRLNGLATWVLRRFIEDQLTGPQPLPAHLRQGLLALVDGPTYGGLFKPKFANKCPADAIEAINSPVAYAVWLKQWSEQHLTPSDPDQAYVLNTRRVDLDALRVDPVTVRGVVSSVEVVSAVLEKSIVGSIGNVQNLNQTLSERRYPNGLPYHHPWVTMDELTRDLGLSVGRLVGWCDPNFPYFLRDLPWGDTSDHALTQAARLSPSLRKVLTEARHFPAEDEAKLQYYRDNFGLLGGNEPPKLDQSLFFNQRTKLTQLALEAVLSVELFAPTVSENAPAFDERAVMPGHAGSVFVNDGLSTTSMGMDYSSTGLEQLNKITELSEDRIDRLNRKIRLDNALQLPSHEADALLSAIISAESNPSASPEEVPSYWITDSTLRALGLFQLTRELYQCTAQEFAAIVGGISIFGRGSEPSQFDRVFNRDTLARPALLIDNEEFALVPETEADALTVAQICGGLNIDLATYFTLAPLIANAHGLTALKRDLPILSSFYRLARLPQILGIAPNLAVEILNLLSADTWVSALVGRPRVNSRTQTSVPDALSVIRRLEGWVRWCADSDLDPAWAVEHVKPIVAPSQPSGAQARLFEQIRTQLAPALFTEAALQMAGVRQLSNGRQWTNHLLELIDQDGLVFHWAESAEHSYEHHAREVVGRVVSQVIGEEDPQTVESIVGVLLSSRSGQHSLVRQSLAVYGDFSSDLALAVLSWSGGTVRDVLSRVLGRTPVSTPSRANLREEAPGDPLLGMLDGFVRRSEVVKAFKLSVEFLTLYLDIGDGVAPLPATGPLTPVALYYLTVYNRAVVLSQKPESGLLGYLQTVNGLPIDLSGDGLGLVQEYTAKWLAELFDWSAEEVRACANRVNPDQGYLRSLEHLDLFTRLRAFSLQSKLDAPTTLKIGALDPDSSFHRYEALAEQIAALLAEQGRASSLYDINAVADRVVVECELDDNELVANSDQSTQLTISVTRGGEPQRNVNIYWASKLCPIDPAVSTTGIGGTATVTVRAGTAMGRDMISYRLDARESQPGVTITLRNDPDSFGFSRVESDIRITEEKAGTDVTLRALLLDQHGNPAVQEPVNWTVGTLLLPVQGLTNAEGMTEVTFTSHTPISVEAKVWNDESSLIFRSINFTR